MPFQTGDRVLVEKKAQRTDDKEEYIRCNGTVICAFNAWDTDGDHWQYKIRGDKGQYIVFYEGKDEGSIIALVTNTN